MSDVAVEAVDGDRLHGVLERSRSLGLLGPGPVDGHLQHAAAFLAAVEPLRTNDRVLDLGSGGGVPGLVIANARPDLNCVLLDVSERRCAFLRWAIAQLDLERCFVLEGRAEGWARTEHRASYRLVVARSFGPPSLLAECAAPFLVAGGSVVVSEPPHRSSALRWPSDGLDRVGLAAGARTDNGRTTLQWLNALDSCPDQFPRSTKAMVRAPLF